MNGNLKPIAEQVIVITGASSGIGLVTARQAAAQGAKLVLVSRNEEALQTLVKELTDKGAEAIHVVADVGDEAQMRRVSEAALTRFGRFDTWINNAGVSIFGRLEEVSVEDQRRLFDTNFWGVVHGSLIAVEHLKKNGGALINLGSEVSDVAVPLQGSYAASKHAVKGFTNSLRLELEEEGAPVSVTLIKPAAMDTMFVPHAKNYMTVEPKLPPPIYAPDLVAKAILLAAVNPQRDVYVGGASALMSMSARYAPRLTDKILERFMFKAQQTNQPSQGQQDNALYQPQRGQALRERQGYKGYVMEVCPYTAVEARPQVKQALMIGAGLALAAWLGMRKRAAAW